MDKPIVSVIIPMYNVSEYIAECLDSVINQDYGIKNIEVILIDDASTDTTKEIAEKYVQKYDFVFIKNEYNQGLSRSRNEGIKGATGEYVMFLDSDDLLYPTSVTTLVEEIVSNEADMALARLKAFDNKGEYGYYSDKYMSDKKITNIFETPNLINCVSVCSKIYKTSFIKEMFFIDNTKHEDNSFSLMVYIKANKIVVIPEYLYKRRYREGENTSIMQNLNLQTFNDLLFNYKYVVEQLNKSKKYLFIYKTMIIKLNNYAIKNVDKKDYKVAKREINNFIKNLKVKNKKTLKIYNFIYCFVNIFYPRRKR